MKIIKNGSARPDKQNRDLLTMNSIYDLRNISYLVLTEKVSYKWNL